MEQAAGEQLALGASPMSLIMAGPSLISQPSVSALVLGEQVACALGPFIQASIHSFIE